MTTLLLVDMDNTIANTDKALVDAGFVPSLIYDRPSIEFEGELEKKTRRIMEEKGFFLNLEPIPNAIETIKVLEEKYNCTVWFVTSPFTSPYCIQEKLEWIQKHFGSKKWKDRVILTKDKTLVRGDFLIDDNPDIDVLKGKSMLQPTWEHVLFSKSYNKKCDKMRINSWDLSHVLSELKF